VTVIATGFVAEAIPRTNPWKPRVFPVRVIDVHTIKPLDLAAIQRAAAETGAIVVAEEHLIDGGLGVRVAQVVGETHPCVMEFVGIHDTYAESGTPEQLLDKYGLVARDVIAAVRRALARKKPRA
jgi:transketolase